MKRSSAFVIIIFSIFLVPVIISVVQAAMATSDNWDDGQIHGWKGNTAWTKAFVVNSGGNPGGYLLSMCKLGGNPSNVIGAFSEEDRYTGNFTSAKINKVAFDLSLMSGQVSWIYLRVRYHDYTYNGWYYELPLGQYFPPVAKQSFGHWAHFEVSFDPSWSDAQAVAAGWQQENLSPSFKDTMSDVYTIEIRAYSPDVTNTSLGIDNFAIYSSDSRETITYTGSLFDIQKRFTGWWYNEQEQGNGLALEIQENRLFAAWFTFDDDGKTHWYTTGGNMTDDNIYHGDLYSWEGWPWGQPYQQPDREKVGTIDLVLNQGDNDTISFSATSNNATISETLTSFMADFSPGQKDSRDITGWWYDPNYEGMGFFIDAQGGKVAMVWYNYRDDKSPRWWTSSGPFASGAQTYSGKLDGWRNGQCLACPYQEPERIDGEGGNITINFIDSTHATMDINGTTISIERFTIPAP